MNEPFVTERIDMTSVGVANVQDVDLQTEVRQPVHETGVGGFPRIKNAAKRMCAHPNGVEVKQTAMLEALA